MDDHRNPQGVTETEDPQGVTETDVLEVVVEEEDPSLAHDQGHPEETGPTGHPEETETGPTAAADPAIALEAQYNRRGAGPSPMTEMEQMHQIEISHEHIEPNEQKYLRVSLLFKGACLKMFDT